MCTETVTKLFDFIEKSPCAYFAVANMSERLDVAGYERLFEGQDWKLVAGGKYYVIRGGSALLAFRIPHEHYTGYQIVASHSDSPSLKVKPNPELTACEHYVKLNVEKYGGMLCAPWFDKPLSVAGRILVREAGCADKDRCIDKSAEYRMSGTESGTCGEVSCGKVVTKLVNMDRDLLMIPNLAIHMNREANQGYKYQIQKDMLPLYGCGAEKGSFMKQIAEAAGVEKEQILSTDLFLYNRMPGTVWGAQGEFLSAPRLDDLQCAFASIEAFLSAADGDSIPVHCVFDNEEVGSGTRQGAASTLLLDTLLRISECMGRTPSEYRRDIANSFMISADNAHAVHPNYPEKYCPSNKVYPNKGIVIKYSGNQKYTTDGVSAAIFEEICRNAEVPYQVYTNHSDEPGGSTLGNISGEKVPVHAVDIGIAQLAMHSPYETCGSKDTDYMIRAMRRFFELSINEVNDGYIF